MGMPSFMGRTSVWPPTFKYVNVPIINNLCPIKFIYLRSLIDLNAKCKPIDHVNFFAYLGDTLFLAACGRFFEGTAQQMHEALIVKLGSLPDNCVSYIMK